MLTCVFEKFNKVAIEEFDGNPLFCVSVPGYTWQCGWNYTDIKLQTIQDTELTLSIENSIRGGISSVMGDRYVNSVDNIKIM